MDVFRSFIVKQDTTKFETFVDVLDIIDEDILHSIRSLYQLLITIPQAFYKVERMFSSEEGNQRTAPSL